MTPREMLDEMERLALADQKLGKQFCSVYPDRILAVAEWVRELRDLNDGLMAQAERLVYERDTARVQLALAAERHDALHDQRHTEARECDNLRTQLAQAEAERDDYKRAGKAFAEECARLTGERDDARRELASEREAERLVFAKVNRLVGKLEEVGPDGVAAIQELDAARARADRLQGQVERLRDAVLGLLSNAGMGHDAWQRALDEADAALAALDDGDGT